MLQRELTAKDCKCARQIWWRGVLLTCTFLLAAGCTQPYHLHNPAHSPKVIQLHWNWQAHPVQFKPALALLSEDERRRLDDFLNEVALKPDHRILVDFGGEGELNRLTQGRIDAITLQLKQHLPGAVVHTHSGGKPLPHGMRVLVGHYLVKIPDCPDRTRLPESDPGNMPGSNFGCATAVNLSRMVADPTDLRQGRNLAPGDAQVLSAAVRRYWEDRVKDPVDPSNKTVTSSATE